MHGDKAMGLVGGSSLGVPRPAAYLLPHCPQAPIGAFLGLVAVVVAVVFRAAAASSTIVILTVVLSETYLRNRLGAFRAVGWRGLMGASTGHGQGTGDDLGSCSP